MMTRSAQGAKTLPGKYYTDQAIYELDPPLRGGNTMIPSGVALKSWITKDRLPAPTWS